MTPTRSLLHRRLRDLAADDDGMSTVEYAVGTVAAAAFAALLYAIVNDDRCAGQTSSFRNRRRKRRR